MKIIEYFKKRKQKKEEKRARQSKTVRILKSIGGTILYLAFIVVLVWGTPRALSYFLNTEYPMAAITSGSMWPELKKNDLVFIEGIDPRTVQIDDIVVFTNEKNAFTIHRVIELGQNKLKTKGDANNVADEPIPYEDVIGRLYKIGNWNARIPKLGFISRTVNKYNQ